MIKPLALALAALFLAPQPDADWRRIAAPFAPHFPRDHGAHLDHRTEWWYATGELASTTSPERFGYQLTIFRQGLDPRPAQATESALRPRHVLAGHLAILDIATGKLVHAERLRRLSAGLANANEPDLDVWLEDWSIKRNADNRLILSATDADQHIGLALSCIPLKPFVVHGQAGVSVKGPDPGNASVYLSSTRAATEGQITFGNHTFAVRGESWFDHEWGTSQLGTGVVGWDWFGLRFDDGRELMLYRLRRADGSAISESSGTLVASDGTTQHLTSTEFTLTPLATWRSDTSHATYPSRWNLLVPTFAIDINIATRIPNCEIDATLSTGTVYWEGPVLITGTPTGNGYAELTGYSRPLAPRF